MGVEVAHKAQSKTITIPKITITIRPLPTEILESQHENCEIKKIAFEEDVEARAL